MQLSSNHRSLSGGTKVNKFLTYSFSRYNPEKLIRTLLTWMFAFSTRIPDCDSQSPNLLHLFVSSDPSFSSTAGFPRFRNSVNAVFSVAIDFPSNSKGDALNYVRPDMGGIRGHLSNIPIEYIFILGASSSAEFCDWVQVGIDLYIPHLRYQVQLHTFPWLSTAGCWCCWSP